MIVLVTDGDQRPALAITRSLGSRGIQVLVGEEKGRSLASSSRYCANHLTYPSAIRDPEGFCRFLLNYVSRFQVDLVIPLTDVTTHLVTRRKEEFLRHTRVCLPDFGAFEFVSDKWALLKHAQKIDIPIPRTFYIETSESLSEVLGQLEYPVVVKPCRSRIPIKDGWISTSVHYADSERELVRLFADIGYLQNHSLIQERVIGPGIGIFLLFDRGELLTAFGHRRIREKPPSGGASVFRASIPMEPQLKEYAVRLFKPLAWDGVAMMEYKLDSRTGQALLMEVNGRFWGSLQLAIDAGVDFPYLLYQLSTRGRVEIPPPYQVGVKSRWLLGDLDHLFLRLFKSRRDLRLPEGFPSRLRSLVEFLKFCQPGVHEEIFSLRDPRPALYELCSYVRNALRIEGNYHA